ncbi:1-deoxy-D-xylulose 5-phosphate reductoisomerase [Deferribacter desulfuricans SSM1]|uniref:1-deoxy-D-xylulose 5-phosphate reductoisomerase n=1 Tax=Deferribacter desulfuricans (strain DSM 14783 / JCM 11476 / NBRC 101012 / SSM1) TaxID=639282 RepID=D3PAL2_DEFDS|nr:1-deoxy-D-xylulose-5-phosphate reductoisomerase [Deferribacter desulfuricans]BAI79635.1 1-deoxy-D-xylulose 5-phosphate reductoisomerase [Deferribacter desulfuricans SSM1]
MKKVGVVGATGSIGTQAIDVIKKNKDKFEVVFISAHSSKDKLLNFKEDIDAKYAILTGVDSSDNGDVLFGLDELLNIIKNEEIDIILSAAVGFSGLLPTYHALQRGIDIALANKESMVTAGSILNNISKRNGAKIIPVDSEHSAIFQSILGHKKEFLEKIILTASGGPFRRRPIDSLEFVEIDEALKHPNWKMGKKITVDSATMMNKGLELIEAKFLFDVSTDKLDVIIHPESIIHSMVSFCDGSYIAQLGFPDMRVPIAYALSYPERLTLDTKRLSFYELEKLTFLKPDFKRYPCLKLAFEVLNNDKAVYYIALNAANEVAVEGFLKKEIKFIDIPSVIESVLEKIEQVDVKSINDIIEVDKTARMYALDFIKKRF